MLAAQAQPDWQRQAQVHNQSTIIVTPPLPSPSPASRLGFAQLEVGNGRLNSTLNLDLHCSKAKRSLVLPLLILPMLLLPLPYGRVGEFTGEPKPPPSF